MQPELEDEDTAQLHWLQTVKEDSLIMVEAAFQSFQEGDSIIGHFLLDKAIRSDPNNVNAYVMKAHRTPLSDSNNNRLRIYEEAERVGKAHLIKLTGVRIFDKTHSCFGHWWQLENTRPYIRALYGLMTTQASVGNVTTAIEIALKILSLCNLDQLGVHLHLPLYYLRIQNSIGAMNFCLNWVVHYGKPPGGGLTFNRSKDELENMAEVPPFALALIRSMNLRHSPEILYSLALSTFSTFGDCKLAAVALDAAFQSNRHVIAHLQSSKRCPRSYIDEDLHPVKDGAIIARNYLVMGYSLWTEHAVKVWWATHCNVVVGTSLLECEGPTCKKTDDVQEAKFKLCSICRLASYCSRECQREHWSRHKRHCRDDQEHKPK